MKVADCITTDVVLPNPQTQDPWDEVVVDPALKDRLLNQVLLSMHLRDTLPFIVTACHGLILLYGPPGTGKTTLARGVAHRTAALTAGHRARLVEVDPHGLMSAEHGQSQQKVVELLTNHIPLLADDGLPTIVLLDEVESMAVARGAASLSANPADVHRATDAVLASLDRIASEHPHIVIVATSNFTDALDEAFKSRADALIEVARPDVDAVLAILRRTLQGYGGAFPEMAELAGSSGLAAVARRLDGWDGRQVRKFVSEALAGRLETVLEPGTLTLADLRTTADRLHAASEKATIGASAGWAADARGERHAV